VKKARVASDGGYRGVPRGGMGGKGGGGGPPAGGPTLPTKKGMTA